MKMVLKAKHIYYLTKTLKKHWVVCNCSYNFRHNFFLIYIIWHPSRNCKLSPVPHFLIKVLKYLTSNIIFFYFNGFITILKIFYFILSKLTSKKLYQSPPITLDLYCYETSLFKFISAHSLNINFNAKTNKLRQ